MKRKREERGEDRGDREGRRGGGVGKGKGDREERRGREVGKNRGDSGRTELHCPQFPPPHTPPRRRLRSKLALKSVGI